MTAREFICLMTEKYRLSILWLTIRFTIINFCHFCQKTTARFRLTESMKLICSIIFRKLSGGCFCHWREDTLPKWEERPYDVVFTGNYTPLSKFEPTIERHGKEYADFYYGIIEDFKKHPHLGMDIGIREHLLSEVEDITEDGVKEMMPNMIMIDLYVRNYFRGKVVQTLVDAGVSVHCFGAGWEFLPCEHPENLIKEGGVDSLACLQALSKAKVSLNVMPWFKDGAHDRVFNSMLNGAVCFTDWSRYLAENLRDGEDIFFYELDALECLPDMVQGILENRKKWEHMQKAAYETAEKSHTWERRAGVLHKEILSKIR